MTKVGFYGLGNLNSAIIDGLFATAHNLELFGYDIDKGACARNAEKDVVTAADPEHLADCSEVIIIGVKPNAFDDVMAELRGLQVNFAGKLLISLVAGKQLRADINWDYPAARVLPNLNAAVCESVSAYAVNDHCDMRHIDAIARIFGQVGQVVSVDERQFDTVFALSGCGPALVYLFINSLAQAAVKHGMDKETATEVAAAMVRGSAGMVLESGEHPHRLIDGVCSPGGMTIEAIHSLYCNAFEGIVINAMEKAILKAKKL